LAAFELFVRGFIAIDKRAPIPEKLPALIGLNVSAVPLRRWVSHPMSIETGLIDAEPLVMSARSGALAFFLPSRHPFWTAAGLMNLALEILEN